MATTSLQSDIHSSSSRKWSLTLPSFRKAPHEVQQTVTSAAAAKDAARVRKAGGAPATTSKGADPAVGQANLGKAVVGDGSGNEKKPSGPESRFRAEASARRRPPGKAPLSTCSPNPAAATPSPLYDEVELAGLKAQMAGFVQHMQQKVQQSQPEAPDTLHRPPPPPPPAEERPAAIRRSSSTASAPKVSGFHRPISTLYRFFRRVINSSYHRYSAAATHEGPASAEPQVGDVQYHYHHYIHHHHHHYHHDPNTAEEAESNLRLRRHSESSGIRPRIPSVIWEENEENVEDAKELQSPLRAFPARRRRHSDNTFAELCKSTSKAGDGGKVDVTCTREIDNLGVAGPAAEMRLFARSLNSDQKLKTGEKAPKQWKDDEVKVGGGETGGDVRSRRRHSADHGAVKYGGWSKGGAGMEDGLRAPNVEGTGGRVYKLSVAGVNYSERKEVGGWRRSEGFDAPAEEVAVALHEKMLGYGLQGFNGGPRLRSPSASPANMRLVAHSPAPSTASRQRQPRRSQ